MLRVGSTPHCFASLRLVSVALHVERLATSAARLLGELLDLAPAVRNGSLVAIVTRRVIATGRIEYVVA